MIYNSKVAIVPEAEFHMVEARDLASLPWV